MRYAFLSFYVTLLTACGGCSAMDTPANLDLSLAHPSARGIYRVTLQPPAEAIAINRIQRWQLRVVTADGTDVSNASIRFDGGMPQHHHGFPTSPRISAEPASGAYRIDGVKFSMGGWWEIKLDIESAHGRDTVTFNTVLNAK